MSVTVLFPIITPIVGAMLTVLVRDRKRLRNAVIIIILVVSLGLNTLLLNSVLYNNRILYGQLIADVPGLFVSEIIFFLGFLVVIYSFVYMKEEIDDTIYYAVLLLFISTMAGMALTYNLLVLFAFFEASTITSAILILFGRTRNAVRATLIYVTISVLEALLILCGIFLVYINAGTVNMLDEGIMQISRSPNLVLALTSLFIFGFGTKAALIPLGPVWLPKAHGEAPSPISAMLSGIMIKLGALAMVRTLYFFYVTSFRLLSFTISGLGVITMVVGIAYALLAKDVTKLLAWHSVSQMGYVITGIGLATNHGILGGFFHLLNHAIFKSLLFLCSGALLYGVGTKRIKEMGGLFRKMPLTATMFILGSLSMSGVPPLNGFRSKSYLHEACEEVATSLPAPILGQVFGITSLIVSFLTFFCLIKASYFMFFGRPHKGYENVEEVPLQMQLPMLVLGFLCIFLGVYPEPAVSLIEKIVEALMPLIGGGV